MEEEEIEERKKMIKNRPTLVNLCIESASSSKESVDTWRRQKRTLERLPPHLADSLFDRLLRRHLLFPSLLEVFQRCVEEVDLRGESNVDAEWIAYLGGFCNLRSLNLADCKSLNDYAIWPLAGLDTLEELHLSRCSKITNAGIKHVVSNRSLEKLYISETGLTSDGVKLISCLTNLRVLDLGGIPVTDKALSSLQVLTGLEYLDLWGSAVSNNGAATLEMFPRLSFLNLAWTKVTKLPYLPSITCLNMSNCTAHAIFGEECRAKVPLSKLLITGATIVDPHEVFMNVETSYMTFLDMSGSSIDNFDFLVHMRKLEHLNLSSSKMCDRLIEYVTHVGEKLRCLNLSKTKITSQAISTLVGHVPDLETLSLSYTEVDDAALRYIGMMTSLRTVDLSHTKIKGFFPMNRHNLGKTPSLMELQNLWLLESLNLEDTSLRDEAIYPLAFFRELKRLYLKSDHLSDIALHALSSPLPKLQILGFRAAVLTNSGLLLYNPPPTLHMLDLRGCWLLTPDVISLFCMHYPRIETIHEHIVSTDINSVGGSSPLPKTREASRSRDKGANLRQAPNFVDERIKYSIEELLELQISPLSSLALQVRDRLPSISRKEIALET